MQIFVLIIACAVNMILSLALLGAIKEYHEATPWEQELTTWNPKVLFIWFVSLVYIVCFFMGVFDNGI